MLVTLDLIASNVYNSVNAPANRNFSYIEAWMMIVYIPIFVAILEYGILLAMKKYKTGNSVEDNNTRVTLSSKGAARPMVSHFDIYKTSKKVDKITFFATVIFIIVSNLIYWSMIMK